jgi:CRP-like cAMP-binding protein
MAKRPDTAKLRDKAAALSAKGKHRKALELYQELERLEPRDGSWSRRTGEMHRHLGDDVAAIAAWNRACDRYAAAGFVVKAVAICKMILRVDPSQTEATTRLAELNSERGIPAAAAKRPADPKAAGAPLEELTLQEMVPGAAPREVEGQAVGIVDIPIDLELSADEGDDGIEIDIEEDLSDGAMTALEKTPLFSELPPASLERMIEKIRLIELPAGQALFRQGDHGSTLFVVAEGEVAVIAEGAERRTLKTLGEGSFFGEISLVTEQARSATVEAVVDSEIIGIDRQVVGELVAEEPAVLTVLLRFLRDRLIENLVETSPLFAPFLGAERMALAARFQFLEVEAGTTLIEQGKVSPALYLLLSGYARVVREGADLARLGGGDICGEMSLLAQGGAVADVISETKCLMLELSAETFRELIMTHPQVLAFVGDLASERERSLAAIAGGGEQYEELSLDLL